MNDCVTMNILLLLLVTVAVGFAQECFDDTQCAGLAGEDFFCKKTCPSDSYPPNTPLLSAPAILLGNTFVVIPSSRQPDFSNQITFFARFSQQPNTNGTLMFYGTSLERSNFAVKLNATRESRTILTIHYSTSDNLFVSHLFNVPKLDDGNDHCLTIVFESPLHILVDGIQAPNTEAILLNRDFTTGMSADNPAHLIVGGLTTGSYFHGTIQQMVIFNEYVSDTASVCSLVANSDVPGQCVNYLQREDACIAPTSHPSLLCISKLDRCEPALRCVSDILGDHRCQFLPSVCTKNDDCQGDAFCGSEVPSYGSSYFESDASKIIGEDSVYISSRTEFDGLGIITRPATDHPDLVKDVTIFAILQQDPTNDGYVIAKGLDRVTTDWGLYLEGSKNTVQLSYRTDTGATETLVFDNLMIDDGLVHTIAAVVDSGNNRAVVYIDGVAMGVTDLPRQPAFQPGFNSLYIGGTPEAVESANNRFKGSIDYLAVYNSVLLNGDIAALNSSLASSELTTVLYCQDYAKSGENCFLGDTTDFRCLPPARCVPVVHQMLSVQLPEVGQSFDADDIIGRCVAPCSCQGDPTPPGQVCGSDGRTYGSACYARCANIDVVDATGPCAQSYGELYSSRSL